jgi:hypothetical protein
LVFIPLIAICFAFKCILKLIYFSISSLNIWFHLIFVFNLILIFLLLFFIIFFIVVLFFNFIHHYFILLKFYTRFGPYLFLLLFFYFFNPFLDFFFNFSPRCSNDLEKQFVIFFVYFFYWVIPISWFRALVLKIIPIWFWSFFRFIF